MYGFKLAGAICGSSIAATALVVGAVLLLTPIIGLWTIGVVGGAIMLTAFLAIGLATR